jgi:hypothetical protein
VVTAAAGSEAWLAAGLRKKPFENLFYFFNFFAGKHIHGKRIGIFRASTVLAGPDHQTYGRGKGWIIYSVYDRGNVRWHAYLNRKLKVLFR